MGEGGASGVGIADRSRDVGGYGGTDVLTEDHRGRHIKLNPTHIQENEGQGHSGAG